MHVLIAALIGLLAGAHAATWGMYKDAIHEGFTWPKYFRSVVVGLVCALALQAAIGFDLGRPATMVVFFGLVYLTERAVIELWKTFLREEDQSKYFIPMQFGIFGTPVKSRAARWSVLAACVAAIGLGVWAVLRWQSALRALPGPVVALGLGLLGGMFTAVGGAWKDAPKEGFSILKFFRSSFVTMAWALLIACFTDVPILIVLSALGYERASIETYKTFFFPSRPRGKFAGKPILHPEMLTRRQRFIPLYAGIWLAVIVAGIAAFSQPLGGLLTFNR